MYQCISIGKMITWLMSGRPQGLDTCVCYMCVGVNNAFCDKAPAK